MLKFLVKNSRSMSTMIPRSKTNSIGEVKLDETEVKICNLLRSFCDFYNKSHPVDPEQSLNNANEPLTLRISGGWVRDKLLGKTSHDIDIAINKLTGEQFALKLNEFIEKQQANGDLKKSSIHKIDKNPERSKHLETVTTKLFGESIDFVNLRNEEYTNVDSRIPTVIEFGTVEQDALRRDATLNALFYNLSSGEIEDFTEKGIEDLQRGILRTPLEPLQTFLDDPLRVLRLIRFAAQFGFDIDEESLKVMKQSPEIKTHLLKKVSKERVGTEFAKLIASQYPLKGLSIINEANLFPVIMSIGENFEEKFFSDFFSNNFPDIFSQDIDLLIKVHDHFQKHCSTELEKLLYGILSPDKKCDEDLQRLFYLCFCFKNFTKYFDDPKQQFKMGKTVYYPIDYIIKFVFKFNKNDATITNKVLTENQDNLAVFNNEQAFSKRSVLASQFVSNYASDSYWKLSLLVNYVNEFGANGAQGTQFYSKIFDYINEQGLTKAFQEKPIISGKELCTLLNRKPGPWLKTTNDLILVWQFDHNQGTLEERKQLLKEYVENLTI